MAKNEVKIATWNINGVNKRLELLVQWLDEASPDVLALQELKTTNDDFPHRRLADAGYGSLVVGERTWNGVALLAKGSQPVEVRRTLPGDPHDLQARYVEAAIEGVLYASLYLPNGNPCPGPKFQYKLNWFERLIAHAQSMLDADIPVALLGDFNVVPTDHDIYPTTSYRDNALLQPASRDAFERLMAQGWKDALRTKHPRESIYTFWDYMRNRWARNAGLRIDHILLGPRLAKRLVAANVDSAVRGREASSDHAPVWVSLR